MAATTIAASQTTANVNTSQHVRDVADRLRYLDPSANPFTLILSAESSSAADNFKFEWAEKGGDFTGAGFAPRWDQINAGAGHTLGDTSIDVDNGEYFRANDLVKVARTGEVMRVTAVTPGTPDVLTVVRGVGSTSAAALVDNDPLVITGTGFAEGADVGTPHDFQETWKYNYTEIKRNPFGSSRTQDQTRNYLGKTRPRARMEAGITHKIDIERAFLFNERNRSVADTSAPRNVTGGVLYWATENNVASVGTLTEAEVWDFAEDVFAHTGGGDTRTLFASGLVCSVIDLIAGARLQVVPKEDTYGVAIKQWVTSHGTFNIVKHRLLEHGSASGTGAYGGEAIALDMTKLKYRPLQTTVLLTDRQGNGVDGWVDEYLTECGLEFSNPMLHGRLKAVTG